MLADDDKMTLAYRRYTDAAEVEVAFNREQTEATIELPLSQAAQYQELLSTNTIQIERYMGTSATALSSIVLNRQPKPKTPL